MRLAHRLVCLTVPCLLLVPAAASSDGGAVRRKPATPPAVARPLAPPAAQGPVHAPIGLNLDAMREDDDVLVRDDDPNDATYAPRERYSRLATPFAASAVGANVRINGATPSNNGESEVSIAALGNRLVAGWNDGQFFAVQPGFTGWGYSSDGGVTWTDAGGPPTSGATDIYYGDPVIVSEPANHWYMANLYRPVAGTFAISVNHGGFAGATMVWGPPVVIASSTTDNLDKPWLGVDPVSGIAYVAYIRFFGTGGQRLEFARSVDHGASWSAPVALTTSGSSAAMSPRIRIGPDGEVYVAYYLSTAGSEYYRIRRSTDFGVSFGAEGIIGGRPFLNNFYSGPAGDNRERVVAQVSIDVDRTSTSRRGTLYATWHEGLDLFSDPLGEAGSTNESEPNESSVQATPFTLGVTLHGNLASNSDQDWYSFSGTVGQTVEFYLAPDASAANGFLRLFAGGGATANRVAYSHFGGGVGLVEFTLPHTGTYYLRVLDWDATGSLGNYVVYTGLHGPQPDDLARDHRDVMFSRSLDGGDTWSAPIRVNDDPGWFDDAWPEVAVDAAGRVFVSWYDHRGDPANGILTDVYFARSDDAGLSFGAGTRINSVAGINWNNVATNMFPNMGDYSALIADGMNVYANWADGRNGSPDSYFAKLVDANTAVGPPVPAAGARLGVRAMGLAAAGSVRVLLTLARAGDVRLQMFDPAGRSVATREFADAGAGDHPIEVGAGLPAGVYLVRAEQAGVAAAAKVVAIR